MSGYPESVFLSNVNCIRCKSEGFVNDPYLRPCWECNGTGKKLGRTIQQIQQLEKLFGDGVTMQYDDNRDARWYDIRPDHAHVYIYSSTAPLRIKPDPLDEYTLPVGLRIGGTVITAGSKMRTVQDTIDSEMVLLTHSVWLAQNGYVVGGRDPNRKTEFKGNYMVADAVDAEGYCIVGDNLYELVEDAYKFLSNT